MFLTSRREFLRNSAALAAALATLKSDTAHAEQDTTAVAAKRGGANDQLNVAMIGVRGQGKGDLGGFAGKHNCVVATVCDVDEDVIGPAMTTAEKAQKRLPKYEKDLRKVLEDKSIDIVSIATPNHWHALAAIWALQAGKHVYVQKPVSHNVLEGRRIVEAARKYNKICQTGTQSRSMPGMRDAIAFLHSGKLGKITLGYGVCYKRRNSIGKVDGPQTPPKKCDYDLWCGPAPVKPLMRKNLHYDWHWTWDYGNGDLGNQGIHEMDKARWGLNKNELARSVWSLGGRFGYVDDGETANTQLCVFDYGDATLLFEVRGLPTGSPYPEAADKLFAGKKPDTNFVGNIWYGGEGFLVCPSYNSGAAFTRDGKLIQRFSGSGDHYGNFVQAVRSGNPKDLHADILEGHLSSALCHLGNISYQLGTDVPFSEAPGAAGHKEVAAAVLRMKVHLEDVGVNLTKTRCRIGPKLTLDPATERFVGNPAADKLLTREYRKGFEVPARV